MSSLLSLDTYLTYATSQAPSATLSLPRSHATTLGVPAATFTEYGQQASSTEISEAELARFVERAISGADSSDPANDGQNMSLTMADPPFLDDNENDQSLEETAIVHGDDSTHIDMGGGGLTTFQKQGIIALSCTGAVCAAALAALGIVLHNSKKKRAADLEMQRTNVVMN